MPGLRVHLAQVADHPRRFGGRWRPERRGSGLQARRRRRRAGTPRPRRPRAGGAPPAAARRDGGGGVRDARGPLPHPPGAVSGRRRPVLPSSAAAPRAPAGYEPRAAEGEVEEGGESPSAGAGARSTGDSPRRQFSSLPENFYCCCRRLSRRRAKRGAEPRRGRWLRRSGGCSAAAAGVRAVRCPFVRRSGLRCYRPHRISPASAARPPFVVCFFFLIEKNLKSEKD